MYIKSELILLLIGQRNDIINDTKTGTKEMGVLWGPRKLGVDQ